MFEIIYYTDKKLCPILEFLKSIPKKDTAKILREIDLLEHFGLSLGLPHIKKLNNQNSIWELRIKFSSNNYRVFFFTIKNEKIILLNAFHKKSNKTPENELHKALTFKSNYLERNNNNETSSH